MPLWRHQPDHGGNSIDELAQLPFALMQRCLHFALIIDVFRMTIPADDPATVVPRGDRCIPEPAICAVMSPEPLLNFEGLSGLDAASPLRFYALEIVRMDEWQSIVVHIEDPTHLVVADAKIREHRWIHELNAAVRMGSPAKARNIGGIGALIHPFIEAGGS